MTDTPNTVAIATTPVVTIDTAATDTPPTLSTITVGYAGTPATYSVGQHSHGKL